MNIFGKSLIGFQDATPLGESLERLDIFYDLGVRIILFTYNLRNLVGDGCLEPGNAGLSLFGRKLISRRAKVLITKQRMAVLRTKL